MLDSAKTPTRAFSRYPLFWIAISFSTGVWAMTAASINIEILAAIFFFSLILVPVLIRTSFVTPLLFVGFFALGGFYFSMQDSSPAKNSVKSLFEDGMLSTDQPIEVEGVLTQTPELAVGGFFLDISIEKIILGRQESRISGKVRLFAAIPNSVIEDDYAHLDLDFGDRIRVATRLEREERHLNPGGVLTAQLLDQKDLDARGIVKSSLLVEKLGVGSDLNPLRFVSSLRQKLIRDARMKFDNSTSGVFIASVFGNRHHLTKETGEMFRAGGTFHILVISGLHVTFIGGILLLVVRAATGNRFVQFAVSSGVLWVYAIAVGAEIPVVRAALMFTIVLFSVVVWRAGSLINSFGASVLIILVWRPQDISTQSLHLTAASMLGIILLAFPLIEKLRAIGRWMPSAKMPFPPKHRAKGFLEAIYWSESEWQKTLDENVWECGISKKDSAARLEKLGLQRMLRFGFEGILVTLAVQIFLLPLTVVYFHRITLGAIILNLWVGGFIVLQNAAAILAMLFGAILDPIGRLFIAIAESLNGFLMIGPKFLIASDLASFRFPVYSGGMKAIYFAYFIPLLFIVLRVNRWVPFPHANRLGAETGILRTYGSSAIKLMSAAFCSLILLIVIHPTSAPSPNDKLTIDFLDVGQGDSALVTFPNGQTMLIDGGGTRFFGERFIEKETGEAEQFEPDTRGIGEAVVSEFLWEKGYSSVDYIVATHSDTDHIKGLIRVVQNFAINTALIGPAPGADKTYEEFRSALAGKRVRNRLVAKGDRFDIGGATVEILSAGKMGANMTSNNSSIVLRITFGTRKFIFTGDIEELIEAELARSPEMLKADVVKVAHHGSRTSSTASFVAAADADYAVIPVGRDSVFGHPHEEVVARWKASGAKVVTTGERGTVTVSTDGSNLDVQFYK